MLIWPFLFPCLFILGVLSDTNPAVYKRDDTSETITLQPSDTPAAQPSPSAASPSNSAANASPTGAPNGVNTAGGAAVNNNSHMTGNGTQPASVAASNNNPFQGKPTFASYSNNIPPAYLTWKKPIPNQTFPPLFKIAPSNITFEWTVDPEMLKVQPVNITVALANPQKQTYTATVVPGTATSALWDLGKVPPESPLMMGYYTVWVYDQRGPKAFPSPGWLMPDSRLVIALYSTEAYVGRSDSMFCPTCYLGAASSIRQSFMPWVVTFAVAVLTSTAMLFSILY